MCLIAFAWKAHPRYRLALIANRDEAHARPALPAQAHAEAPDVFGGRDQEKGGSWLLVSRAGRFAAVTNVREGLDPVMARRSRGELVDGFVKSSMTVAEYLDLLSRWAWDYGRFNLLLSDGDDLFFASNHPGFRQQAITPGLHSVSNGDFNAPWPKAMRATEALATWLNNIPHATTQPDVSDLFEALRDTRRGADALLPDTGVGLELERLLSSPFIVGTDYGTRASTVLLFGHTDIHLHERSHGADGDAAGSVMLTIPLAND